MCRSPAACPSSASTSESLGKRHVGMMPGNKRERIKSTSGQKICTDVAVRQCDSVAISVPHNDIMAQLFGAACAVQGESVPSTPVRGAPRRAGRAQRPPGKQQQQQRGEATNCGTASPPVKKLAKGNKQYDGMSTPKTRHNNNNRPAVPDRNRSAAISVPGAYPGSAGSSPRGSPSRNNSGGYYAGAKFCESPSANELPPPPIHWVLECPAVQATEPVLVHA